MCLLSFCCLHIFCLLCWCLLFRAMSVSRAVKDQMVAMWASLDEAHLGQIDRPRIFKFLKSQGLSIDSEADVNVSVSFAVVLSPLAKCLSLSVSLSLSFSLFKRLSLSPSRFFCFGLCCWGHALN